MAKVRKIKSKDLLSDVRHGMSDAEIMRKHNVTAQQLLGLFKQMMAAGVLRQSDLDERIVCAEDSIAVIWECPSCSAVYHYRVEKCPKCGTAIRRPGG